MEMRANQVEYYDSLLADSPSYWDLIRCTEFLLYCCIFYTYTCTCMYNYMLYMHVHAGASLTIDTKTAVSQDYLGKTGSIST